MCWFAYTGKLLDVVSNPVPMFVIKRVHLIKAMNTNSAHNKTEHSFYVIISEFEYF